MFVLGGSMFVSAILLVLSGPSLSLGLHLKYEAGAKPIPLYVPERPVVDVVLFNGEQDMFALRVNELSTVVDLFMVYDGYCTFTGQHKKRSFKKEDHRFAKFRAKIRHVRIPCYADIESTKNERDTHKYMQKHLPTVMRKEFGTEWVRGAVIASDVDELPVAQKLKDLFQLTLFWQNLESKFIYRVLGSRYYYNTRCALWLQEEKLQWKGGHIFSGKLMDNTTSFDDLRSRRAMDDSFDERLLSGEGHLLDYPVNGTKRHKHIDLPGYGWHFSYFMNEESMRDKIKSLSPNLRFTDLEHIRRQQETCKDPFERELPLYRVPDGVEGTPEVPFLPAWLKEAAGDGRLPESWLTGVPSAPRRRR